jgi:hypothetical protein
VFKRIKKFFESEPEPQPTAVYLVYLADPDLGQSPFDLGLPRPTSPFHQPPIYVPPVPIELDRGINLFPESESKFWH